nr:hypothetical protein [Cytophagales bacterium]
MILLRTVSVAVFMFCGLFAGAGQANDFGLVGGNRAFSLKVSSFKAQRFKQVIPQHYDFSCGSAAVATLLKYHYNIETNEQEVLDSMYEVGDQEKIKTQGFSLLDMKQYLDSLGFRADGFRVDLDKIKSAGIPGIVLINTNGYTHFVVVQGINDTHILLGDPALGKRKLAHRDFIKIWNNVFFVIRNNPLQAQLKFDHDDRWAGRRKVLFETALSNQSLSTFSVSTAFTPNVF